MKSSRLLFLILALLFAVNVSYAGRVTGASGISLVQVYAAIVGQELVWSVRQYFNMGVRITGIGNFTTGRGLELGYNHPTAYVTAYDRDAATARELDLSGAPTTINANGAYTTFGGGLVFKRQTSAQLKAQVAQVQGEFRQNSDTYALCTSTDASTAGAWVVHSSSTTACD